MEDKKTELKDKPKRFDDKSKTPIGDKKAFDSFNNFVFSFNNKLFTRELKQYLSPISDIILRSMDKQQLLKIALIGEQKLHGSTSNRDLRQTLATDSIYKPFTSSIGNRDYVPFVFVLTIAFICVCIDFELRSEYDVFLMNNTGYVHPKFFTQLSNIVRKTVSRGCTVTPFISKQYTDWLKSNGLTNTIWDSEYVKSNQQIKLALFSRFIDKASFDSYGIEYVVASLGKYQLQEISLLSSLDVRINLSDKEITISADDFNSFAKVDGIVQIDRKQAAYAVLLTPKLYDFDSDVNRSVPLGIGTVYTVVTPEMVLDCIQSFITYGNPGKQKADSDVGFDELVVDFDQQGGFGGLKFNQKVTVINKTIDRLLSLGLIKCTVKYIDVLHQLMSRPG